MKNENFMNKENKILKRLRNRINKRKERAKKGGYQVSANGLRLLPADTRSDSQRQNEIGEKLRTELSAIGTSMDRPKNCDLVELIKSDITSCHLGSVWGEFLDFTQQLDRVRWLIYEVERLRKKIK